jgi:hypothetical protein
MALGRRRNIFQFDKPQPHTVFSFLPNALVPFGKTVLSRKLKWDADTQSRFDTSQMECSHLFYSSCWLFLEHLLRILRYTALLKQLKMYWSIGPISRSIHQIRKPPLMGEGFDPSPGMTSH